MDYLWKLEYYLYFDELSIFKSQEKLRAYWFSILGLVFTVLTLLAGYQLVSNWVKHEDWSALLDVVPFMFLPLGIYVVVMLLSNALLVRFINKKSGNCSGGAAQINFTN